MPAVDKLCFYSSIIISLWIRVHCQVELYEAFTFEEYEFVDTQQKLNFEEAKVLCNESQRYLFHSKRSEVTEQLQGWLAGLIGCKFFAL